MLNAEVNQAPFTGDSCAIKNVELGLLEGRRHLVLHHFHPGPVSHGFRSLFQCLDATNIEANRGVELERLTAGGGLGAAEEDANFLSQLVDEDDGGSGLIKTTGELAKSLRHESCLEAHVGVSHVSFELCPRDKRCYRVDND